MKHLYKTSTITLLSVLPELAAVDKLEVIQSHTGVYQLQIPLVDNVTTVNFGPLGQDVGSAIRITRQNLFWLTPVFARTLPHDVDTQLILLKLPVLAATIIPVTTFEYMGTLRGSWRDILAKFHIDHRMDFSKLLFGVVIVAFAGEIRDAVRFAVDGVRSAQGLHHKFVDLNPESHIFSSIA